MIDLRKDELMDDSDDDMYVLLKFVLSYSPEVTTKDFDKRCNQLHSKGYIPSGPPQIIINTFGATVIWQQWKLY